MSVRLVLGNSQWSRMAPHLPGKPGDPGRSGADNRLFAEAVLWLARTGSPWRDLPEFFGNWNSVFVRFSRWSKDGVCDRLFAAMADDPDFEYIMVELDRRPGASTCGRRKRGPEARAIGRSRGGLTTKIHAVVDALGNPLRFILSPGQASDYTEAEALIADLPAEHVLGDKGYDCATPSPSRTPVPSSRPERRHRRSPAILRAQSGRTVLSENQTLPAHRHAL